MTGIILKDLKEAFFLKKNTISWLFSILMVLLCIFVLPVRYIYVLCVVIVHPMLGASILQYSIEQDEISGFDKILLTYPITKKEIILSKYISGILLNVVLAVINFILALQFSFGHKVIGFTTAMEVWFLGIILSILFMAANYMMFFWLGNKKGTLVYLIITVMLALGYIVSYYSVDLSGLAEMSRSVLMAAGFLLSVLALVGSYFASIKIYTKNHVK